MKALIARTRNICHVAFFVNALYAKERPGRARSARRMPDGCLGVIRIRGSNVCAGYEPEAAPPNPDADGWLDTGDLGYFRDGHLSFFARLKEVICHNGLNYALLGGDSLSLFDLAAAIERDFSVYAETKDLAEAHTVAKCALLVERLTAAHAARIRVAKRL